MMEDADHNPSCYTIRFPVGASKELADMAADEGVPVPEFIRRAINFYQVKMEAVKHHKTLMLQGQDGTLEVVAGCDR